VLVIWLAKAPITATLTELALGAVGTSTKRADVAVVFVSLALASAGLLITFTAGQWNIGLEGQIGMGAILATAVGRAYMSRPSPWALVLMAVAGIVGGGLWGLLTGALKIWGKVNEIFGGLGLNFVARAVTIYLIFNTWKQPTGGTLSGTEQFPQEYWLPTFPGLRASPYSLGVALVVLVVAYLALRGTTWGLRLKAVGKSLPGAEVIGIPTRRTLMTAYLAAGGLAGLAGNFLVSGVHHRLIPDISSGYGFTGILVVLLAAFKAWAIIPVALFLAAINVGGPALQIRLGLDTALSGVIQGLAVLSVLFVAGWRQKRAA
jgi:simple sugar transport system permease protein